MKIVLDTDRCVGHGRCYALAPELFDADDDGHCLIREEASTDLDPTAQDKAKVAVANCPEDALSLQ